jgi:uncharacterized membrane protein YgcG
LTLLFRHVRHPVFVLLWIFLTVLLSCARVRAPSSSTDIMEEGGTVSAERLRVLSMLADLSERQGGAMAILAISRWSSP